MNILLTGSDGYIGSVASQVLMKAGFEVTGLDTGFYRRGWFYNGIEKFPTVLTKDTRDVTVEDLQGFDAIVHMADLSNDPLGETNPELTQEINHLATVQLAKKAKQAGVKRFVHMSSCSVYGVATEDVVSEKSEINPQTEYARCKALVERDVTKLGDDNFSPTFMRNSTVYGASPRIRFDLVVNNLAGLAFTTNTIAMTSDGSPWRPLVHVLDLSKAIVCILKAPQEKIHNQIFNVGNNDGNYRVKEVAEIIGQIFTGSKVTFGNSDGDTRSYRVNFDKIHSTLPDFRCDYDVKKGAEQLKKIFEQVAMNSELFAFEPFTRIKELKRLMETNQIDEKYYWRST